MSGKTKRSMLVLTDDERRELEETANSRVKQMREVQRANILLDYAEGKTISSIKKYRSVSRPTIYKCIDKALAGGVLFGLKDFYHKPKPSEITDEAKIWAVNTACTKPKEHGLAAEFWTFKALAEFTRTNAPAQGHGCLAKAGKSTIWRILNEHPVKPHKKRYYLEKRDERFEEKMKEILIVYKEVKTIDNTLKSGQIPDIVTISGDEMTGIQAVKNVAGDLPPEPGKRKEWRRDYQYERLGTLSIIAGIDLHTGHIIAEVNERNRSSEFISFLKKTDSYYPKDCKIRLILDNYKIHTSKETMAYLKTRQGRFVYVHTPVHGSWLNLIETLFSKISRTFLKGIRVESRQELKERIIKGIEEMNEFPIVFRWNKFIIDSVKV